jgi:hypothetical protein
MGKRPFRGVRKELKKAISATIIGTLIRSFFEWNPSFSALFDLLEEFRHGYLHDPWTG